MNAIQNKEIDKSKKSDIDQDGSFKNALYSSLIFVAGGIGFFWILLYVIFTIRG